MKKMLAIPALILALCAVLLTGCGGGDDSASTTDTGSTSGASAGAVEIVDYEYMPAELTVPAGTTVRFTNKDSAAHTATSKQSGAFDSGTIKGGATGEITLEETGTFAYFCAFHPFMKGTVTVE
jgi:plastocyanin